VGSTQLTQAIGPGLFDWAIGPIQQAIWSIFFFFLFFFLEILSLKELFN
jgi:hypothetical protein